MHQPAGPRGRIISPVSSDSTSADSTSADSTSADYDRDHHASTLELVGLLAYAVSEFQSSIRWSSVHALGELVFTVSSNDVNAAEFLTRCLLPAGTKEKTRSSLEIFVFTGSSPPFTAPPAWNLPHTDPRHLERLHLSADGMVSAFYDHDRQFWMILDKHSGRALLWISRSREPAFLGGSRTFQTTLAMVFRRHRHGHAAWWCH